MAAQRGKSAVAADHRSILPSMAGLPWWGAVMVAAVATAIGIAFDGGSGSKDLSAVFSTLYVIGCLAAVLVVRQSAVFTAVIQPPLILFCAVPGAYWLIHGAGWPGLKNIAINCGYPLIERFPLMLFTAAVVLLIGMVRWYLGMLGHASTAETEDTSARRGSALAQRLSAMLTAAVNRKPAHAIEQPGSRTRAERTRPRTERTRTERSTGDRPRRATPEARRAARERAANRTTERRRGTNGSTPTRSRHIKPAMDEVRAPERRRRPAPDLRDEPMPRRRRNEPGWRDDAPRRRAEPPQRANRDARARSHRPTESPESLPRRRPAAGAGRSNGATTSHHPVSNVRYRGEPSTQPPSRPRRQRAEEADSWEYDI
ncbi:DUF6542 domain-containing protein [[Mycobacterium] zoologicum]|uniref:DUF6542 domain-containing protein n=1 Tax=[Mycobacterium] zoologicum TaxID=2872311 RepID=UPI001CDAD3D9|nr:DUF6542 domain-containing protein [Mycolicibacter sp. MYC101]MEB3061378.1 DUF6542 domain-containing protein [Mycolicibacter sp. MYC101]